MKRVRKVWSTEKMVHHAKWKVLGKFRHGTGLRGSPVICYYNNGRTSSKIACSCLALRGTTWCFWLLFDSPYINLMRKFLKGSRVARENKKWDSKESESLSALDFIKLATLLDDALRIKNYLDDQTCPEQQPNCTFFNPVKIRLAKKGETLFIIFSRKILHLAWALIIHGGEYCQAHIFVIWLIIV